MSARRFAPWVLLLLAGCGDDPRVAPRTEAPSSPVSGATPIPAPTPPPGPAVPASVPPPTPTAARSGASGTTPDMGAAPRVGDACTWELRVAGSTSVTRLTWTTRAVDAHRVRVLVESSTRDAKGRELARTSTEEATPRTAPPREDGEPVEVEIGGRPLAAWRTREEDHVVTRSHEVPHGGIVRLEGPGGLEQVLVAYVRGP